MRERSGDFGSAMVRWDGDPCANELFFTGILVLCAITIPTCEWPTKVTEGSDGLWWKGGLPGVVLRGRVLFEEGVCYFKRACVV